MRVNLPPMDAGTLKYFAAVIMLIDHTACAFLENGRDAGGSPLMYSFAQGELADRLLRAVGRQAFPIFCFFLVEGFLKTHSRVQYFMRLVIFAVLAQVPFQKCIFPRSANFHGSVMCTLCIGMLSIWVIDAMRKAFAVKDPDLPGDADCRGGPGGTKAPLPRQTGTGQGSSSRILKDMSGTVSALLFILVSCSSVYSFSRLAALLRTDYSYGGVILIVLLYLFQKYRIPGLLISWAWLSWYNNLELYAAPAFFLLACYNGKRGRQHKYFFYFFYPVHLLILWLVRRHFFGL